MFRLTALALILASPAYAQERITITHPSPETSHLGVVAAAIEAYVEAETEARYDIVVQRLHNERAALESVQLGAQEFAITTTGPAGNFVPEVRVFDIPFLLRDRAHAHAVLDGAIGQDVLARFDEAGLTGLAWGENGFRHLTTGAAEVGSPADLDGLKIRTMENPPHIAAWRSVGVLPTPMVFSELPTALQQGTVDGQENPIPVILSNNLDQLQGSLYLTGHVYSPVVVAGFPGFLVGLSDKDRVIFEDAARVAASANRERVSADEAAGVDELVERGMNVVAVDNVAYQAAMAGVMAEFETEFGAETLTAIAAE